MPQQIVGPLTYIDVRGQDQGTAAANFEAAGILYAFAENGVYSSDYAVGEIAAQDPDPDITTEIGVDDVVILTVSLGAQGLVGFSVMRHHIHRKRRRSRRRKFKKVIRR